MKKLEITKAQREAAQERKGTRPRDGDKIEKSYIAPILCTRIHHRAGYYCLYCPRVSPEFIVWLGLKAEELLQA